MNTEKNSVGFFMGANAPDGFYSLYHELTQPIEGIRRFWVKGGPGTDTSKLIEHVAETFAPVDRLVEHIHSPWDPDKLEGVILHTGKASIVDASLPHAIEPTYPGGFDTVVDLWETLDEEKLEKRLLDLVELQTSAFLCQNKCRRLLKCADILLKDNYYFVESCTNPGKVAIVAARICKRELPKTDGTAKEHRRLLSNITGRGIVTLTGTVTALCDKIYLLRDEYGVSSNLLLQAIRLDALKKGYEIVSCYCPLSPDQKLEHLFIPALRLGFITQTRFNSFDGITTFKAINFTRFTNMEKLKRKKQYLSFNRKAAYELIGAAVNELSSSNTHIETLSKQYDDAADPEAIRKKTDEVLQKISRRYSRQ